jgi:hypothetical protein
MNRYPLGMIHEALPVDDVGFDWRAPKKFAPFSIFRNYMTGEVEVEIKGASAVFNNKTDEPPKFNPDPPSENFRALVDFVRKNEPGSKLE